jgi:hypothetical protein
MIGANGARAFYTRVASEGFGLDERVSDANGSERMSERGFAVNR